MHIGGKVVHRILGWKMRGSGLREVGLCSWFIPAVARVQGMAIDSAEH